MQRCKLRRDYVLPAARSFSSFNTSSQYSRRRYGGTSAPIRGMLCRRAESLIRYDYSLLVEPVIPSPWIMRGEGPTGQKRERRDDMTPDELRVRAAREANNRAARRMLAVANALDGAAGGHARPTHPKPDDAAQRCFEKGGAARLRVPRPTPIRSRCLQPGIQTIIQ